MEIERRKVDELKAAEYNPRKDLRPGDAEYEKLKRSIQEFGYVEPVIWNKRTGTVVGGHQRLKVMKDLGYEEVDCVVVDLDEKKEKALNIALNKISGEWDNDLLANLLKDLDTDMGESQIRGIKRCQCHQSMVGRERGTHQSGSRASLESSLEMRERSLLQSPCDSQESVAARKENRGGHGQRHQDLLAEVRQTDTQNHQGCVLAYLVDYKECA